MVTRGVLRAVRGSATAKLRSGTWRAHSHLAGVCECVLYCLCSPMYHACQQAMLAAASMMWSGTHYAAAMQLWL
jgi:hypothetical protein